MKHVTGNVMDGLHRLSANLRPASLDRLGLVPALRQLATESRRNNGLQVEFMTVGLDDPAPQGSLDEKAESRLPAEFETMLYRIIQEALTNISAPCAGSACGHPVGATR